MSKTDNGTDECSLCRKATKLQVSHIIPAFVGKWLKDSSVTRRIRSAENPNVSRQDIQKYPLLCADCEQLLGREDAYFAEHFFVPHHYNGVSSFEYSYQLNRYCTGQSFRVLSHLEKEYGDISGLPWGLSKLANKALSVLSVQLLSKGEYQSEFSHHLVFFGLIEEIGGDITEVPRRFNRYCTRAIDFDLLRGGNRLVVYSKMCRIALFTFLSPRNPRNMIGTRVYSKGRITSSQDVNEGYIGEFLLDRAHYVDKMEAATSDRQKQRIVKEHRAKHAKFLNSEAHQTNIADLKLEEMARMNRSCGEDIE